MKLSLLRHGEAGTARSDALRALTARGRCDASCIGEYLHGVGGLPDTVWVSPLLRARQTLDCVLAANRATRPVHEEPLLVPEADVAALLQRLAGLAGDALLVGHNPLLSQLLAVLVDGERPRGASPQLGTAHLAVLEGDLAAPGCMRLRMLKTPDDTAP